MGEEEVDRVLLTVYESDPDPNATGHWYSPKIDYYPFEMLEETEQEMILGKKHYTVVALVKENVRDVVNYEGEGVEEPVLFRVAGVEKLGLDPCTSEQADESAEIEAQH